MRRSNNSTRKSRQGWNIRGLDENEERNVESKRGTETVVTNIAIKLNIHSFQKKSKRAGKNIGLFRTFFVPVYIAHFKSCHDYNRLETFCWIYASLSCLIWIAISFDFATKFLKRRSVVQNLENNRKYCCRLFVSNVIIKKTFMKIKRINI